MKRIAICFMTVIISLLMVCCKTPTTYNYSGEVKGKDYNVPSSTGKTLDDTVTQFHFLNVNRLEDITGSADCIAIIDKGVVTVIDSGNPTPSTKNAILNYFNDLGIYKIDHLILSHAHDDHGGMMEWMISYYDIGCVYLKGTDWNRNVLSGGETWGAIYNGIKNSALRKINSDGSFASVVEVKEVGYTVKINDESKMTFYFSEKVYSGAGVFDYNCFSLTTKYTCNEASAYLAGDATEDVDEEILGTVGKCSLLKVAHHGTSGPYNSIELLTELDPDFAVITTVNSAVSEEMKDKLKTIDCPYLCTGDATVVYSTDGKTFKKI